MSFPFVETTDGGQRTRVFAANVEDEELTWHRDDEDRIVTVVECDGWYFQRDDELPFEMKEGDTIHIPRHQWHRVIKRGDSRLVVTLSSDSSKTR